MSSKEPVIRKALRKVERSILETGEGLTEQAHKKITDMNFILRDYAKTGLMKHAKNHEGTYDDISVTDFQDAMFKVTQAQNMFNDLPSQIKKRFGHNPAEFLEFVQNPNNATEMASLGILKGNDGLDIKGAATKAATKPDYDEAQAKLAADKLAAEKAKQEV